MAPVNLSWSSTNRRGLRNLVTWIAAGIPMLVAAVIPLGWFMAGYAYETSRVTTTSELAADEISKFIYFNPEFWQFDENRLAQVMSSFVRRGSALRLRIVNNEGRQISQIGEQPLWPAVMFGTNLNDGSNIVGRIEFWHSFRGLVKDSLIAGVVGIPLALLIFATLRMVPLRALDRTMKKLEESEQALKGRVSETESALQMRVNELQNATERLRQQRRELKQYAENATESRDAAVAANRSKSEFLANMSHELRTPLNAVIGFSDMMRNELLGPVNNPKYLSYAEDIHSSGQHLLGLINDILDISKIEAGEMELYEETVDIAQIVRSSLTLVKSRAEDGGVKLENHATDPLPAIFADARKIKQIIINLLSNAVKFTPAEGTVTIVAAIEDDGSFSILVKDTGIGIAPEDIENVIKPFTQADSTLARKYEGTGLGLPLTKALIELHDGRFELTSEQGIGTSAVAYFPAHRVTAEEVLDQVFKLHGVA